MTTPSKPRDAPAERPGSREREEPAPPLGGPIRGILDAVSEAVYIQDAGGRFLDVNEGAVRMYGHPKAFFIGRTPDSLSAPGRNDPGAIRGQFEKALLGEPQQLEFWGLRQNGEIFPKEVRLYPSTHLGQKVVVAVAQDISARRLAEQTQRATYRVAEAAVESSDAQALFAKVHAIIRDLMPSENLYVALWNQEDDTLSFPYWVDSADPRPEPRRLRRGLTEYVLRTGKPLLADEQTLLRLEAEGQVEPFGTLSLDWLGVPLRNDQEVFGALVIQSYEGGHRYTPGECDLLAFVSGQVALAIARTAAQVEQRILTAAMDRAVDPIFGTSEAGRFIFVNQAAWVSLGYSREELLGKSVWDVDPRVTPSLWLARWEKLRNTGSNREETFHRRKDGSLYPVEISSGFVASEGQEVIFTSVRDISFRQAAEQALRSSEEKFSRTFHASPDAININRLDDGAYVDWNENFERVTGWSRQEIEGRTSLELNIWVNPEDRAQAISLIRAQGGFTSLEFPFRRKDGTILIGMMSAKAIEVEGVPCLLTVTRDITDRKAAEATLRIAEQRLRTVLANSQAIIYQLDPEGRFLLSEGLGLAHLGLVPGEVVGMDALEVYREDTETTDQIKRALRGEASRQVTRAAGRLFDHSLTPVLDEASRLESVIGIATDVTERQQMEEDLRAERGLFIAGPVLVIRWKGTPPWPVDYISPNVHSILGYTPEELTSGKLLFDSLVHPEDVDRVHSESAMLRGKGVTHFEQTYRIRDAAGDYRWFQDFTATTPQGSENPYFLGYMLDITDRRRAEDSLRQSQKLESLGILAGGIAHDFNNLLTVILGNLNLAQMHVLEDARIQPYLANMEATVHRATELTKQMLAYSGRGHFQVRPQDLNEVVREMTHLLEVSITKKTRLRFDLEPRLMAIQADAAQIQQVVMNLVINAADAIGEKEGTIHLATSLVHLDERELQMAYQGVNLMPGPYVVLEVADTGCGMTPEVMARIFDPFYTTKAAGRGLGLSAMLGILRGHGAGIAIQSEVGRGSTFRLCFPASPEDLDATEPAKDIEPHRPLRGRILLVDDEDLILEAMGAALEAMGLEVSTARDGLEALARFREASPRFDVVLMDLTMPRMDGREAFQAMRDLDPAVLVVLSSGFTEQDSLLTPTGPAPAGFMQKPYQISELRRMLQRVLGS